MLRVNIVCIGKLKEKYLQMACSEYVKRLSAFCKIEIIELNEYKVPANPSKSHIDKAISVEGEYILNKINNQSAYNIPMCIEGKMLSSEQLAEKFNQIAINGKSEINLIIGGSFGLLDEVKKKGDFKLSISPMTFTHQLARIMILEQVYRAFQISNNGKYHK